MSVKKSSSIVKVNSTKVYYGKEGILECTPLLKKLSSKSRVFILCDPNTSKYCLPSLYVVFPFLKERSETYIVRGGERSKSLKTAEEILSFLMKRKAGRSDILLALGGGVITDLTGFVASVYKRGMKSVYIPTSLIGMADAAIGGKNGIDFKGIKNSVGTFYDPEMILVWTGFLATLSEDEIRSGIAEIFKTAAISGGSLWKEVAQKAGMCVDEQVILLTIKNKAKIVNRDYFDTGARQILNFGHTIGHALESCSMTGKFSAVSHGEAVAAGLICELYLSTELLSFSKSIASESVKVISHIFEPLSDGLFDYDTLLPFLLQDKKNKNGNVMFSLLKAPGEPVLEVKCSEKQIKDALNYYIKVYSKKKAE